MKSAAKKRAEKTAGKTARQPQIESVDRIVATNYYIKLGILPEELVALKQIAQLFGKRKSRTSGRALKLVVGTALLHWDKLESYALSDQDYIDAEGFAGPEIYRREAIRRKFQSVKAGGAQ